MSPKTQLYDSMNSVMVRSESFLFQFYYKVETCQNRHWPFFRRELSHYHELFYSCFLRQILLFFSFPSYDFSSVFSYSIFLFQVFLYFFSSFLFLFLFLFCFLFPMLEAAYDGTSKAKSGIRSNTASQEIKCFFFFFLSFFIYPNLCEPFYDCGLF